MSELPDTLPDRVPQPPPSKHREWLIIGGVLACVAIAILVAGHDAIFGSLRPAAPPEHESAAIETPPLKKPLEKAASKPTPKSTTAPQTEPSLEPTLIDDDGKTLWAPPTNGKPLDLAYLAPGAQIIVAVRPAALAKHAEWEKLLAALGPLGKAGLGYVEHATHVQFADIERLLVGCQVTSDGRWLTTLVAHTSQPITREALAAKLPGATEKDYAGKKYLLAAEQAYYLPGGNDAGVLVVAPEDAIHDVIDLAGQTPPLRRDIERLIDYTDADRQLTVVFAPNSLFSEGQSIFNGEVTRLRDPLFWFLGDEFSGAALSLNWDENFFVELIATPTLETSPQRAARIFADRVSQVPKKLEPYVKSLNTQPYGKQLVSQFPAMLRTLVAYTRSGFESDHAVLRCYLPVVAGHNLLLAADLTLAETPAPSTPPGEAASAAGPPTPTNPPTLKQRLTKLTSLRFAKDTLESALEQLSQDIDATIIIRGPDLQADGITKNQSFGIDLSNQPAEQILIEILRLANPDKTSPGTHDVRQKLVYIIEQQPDKTEQIVVTTRARARDRRDELPAAFRPQKATEKP